MTSRQRSTSTRGRRRAASLALLGVVLAGLVAAATALAAAPKEQAQPSLEGTFRRGSTITTSTGSWSGSPTDFDYRWQRCDGSGQNCVTVAGETKASYSLAAADVGRTVRAIVVAKNADGSSEANTKPSPVISDDVVPTNTKAPTISGAAVVGGTLTADEGTWTGGPSFQFIWLQCDAGGSSCGDTQARGRRYGVRSDDVGKTIRVQVRASNPRGTTISTSTQTAVVRASGGGGDNGPAVPVSSVSLPERLVISAFGSSPTVFRNRIDPVTLRVRVADTRGRLVSGALVLATAVPFGRVTSSAETTTSASGIAEISVRPTFRLPLQRGSSVVFFLRARKPGDNPLAGVSTRRLVQVRVVPG